MPPSLESVPKKVSDRWYHRSCWYNIRKLALARDPICYLCNRAPSIIVDHKVPHKGAWGLFLDLNNLGGCCKKCHDIKTASEDGGYGHKQHVGQHAETAAAVPTGTKGGGKEFQSSCLDAKKLDKALELEDDFLEGIPE